MYFKTIIPTATIIRDHSITTAAADNDDDATPTSTTTITITSSIS